MKAVRIHEFGNSDKLQLEDIEIPKIINGQVLVKVRNVGVNPIDYKIREGIRGNAPLPMIVGQDFAGEVVEVGPNAKHVKVGDRVFGFARGAYAEYAIAEHTEIALIPKNVDEETASAIPTAAMTAWQIIMEEVKVQKGQRVLIHGGAGGVGSFAIQICHYLGAEIITTASGEDERYLKKIGAHEVIDYKLQDFTQLVSGVDFVLDLVGGETFKNSYKVLKSGGTLATTMHESQKLRDDVRLINFVMRKKDKKGLTDVIDLVSRKIITVNFEEALELEDAKAAQDHLQFNHKNGKVVLRVA